MSLVLVFVGRLAGVLVDHHPAHRVSGHVGLAEFAPVHAPIFLEAFTPWGYIAGMQVKAKTSALQRLKRIEGQVRGLARMVETDRYCIDIVTQISAVRAALRAVEVEILSDHVANCVEHAIASGNKAEQRRKVAELMDVLSRAAR